MIPKNIDKLKLIRVNPFQGLIIDDAIWRDSHEYHRNHQRLHSLAIHGPGIIAGLDVIANQSPDLSIIINPGIGIDPEGNTIIVSKRRIPGTEPDEIILNPVIIGTVYINAFVGVPSDHIVAVGPSGQADTIIMRIE